MDLATVSGVVEAYSRQNPEQPGYRAIESGMGFHIVPASANDARGKPSPPLSILDTVVSVPVESRTASEHVAALCLAVTNATGIPTDFWNSALDRYYAANGYLLPGNPTKAERPYMLFRWGTTATCAREALISLLAGSATSLSWRFHCGPAFRRNESDCMLGFQPLQVGPRRVVVAFDRCTKCKVVPRQ